MRIIDLDATKWKEELDFYADLLWAIEAPEWHVESVAALVDSMIYVRINTVEPPYVVRVLHAKTPPKEIREHIEVVKDALDRARIELCKWHKRDVEVTFEIRP